MRYRLEVLSPIHIGNGLEISPMEYVVDDSGFYRVDMDSLFRDKDFSIDDFIKNTELDSFYLGEFYGGIAKRHKRYVLEVSDSAKNSMRIKKNEVREFIKTGGGVYIPGSSIKGAIRTAFLWSLLKDDDGWLSKVKYLEEIARGFKKVNKNKVDDKIEQEVFGKDPKYDFFKLLRVSDSNILPYSSLSVNKVRILTKKFDDIWKRFDILLETINVGTNFELDISIDRSLMDADIFSNVPVRSLDDLGVVCSQFSLDLIDYELDFFKSCNVGGILDNVNRFYRTLREIRGGILLRISWGSGWHSMTIGRILDGILIDMLRRRYGLGRKGVPVFPKTRKLIFGGDKPIYPLGWIKLEEIE